MAQVDTFVEDALQSIPGTTEELCQEFLQLLEADRQKRKEAEKEIFSLFATGGPNGGKGI